MPEKSTILVAAQSNSKLLGGERVWKKIDLDRLRTNLGDLVANLGDALPAADVAGSGFRMTQIEVAVTVGAEGEVGILGTGVSASAEASLTLTLSRE